MSNVHVIYVGPYILCFNYKESTSWDDYPSEITGDVLCDFSTDFLPDGQRTVIPNEDRDQPRDFYFDKHSGDFTPIELNDADIFNEKEWLYNSFEKEIELLKPFCDRLEIRWGILQDYH